MPETLPPIPVADVVDTPLPDLPWGQGSRRHAWLWAAVAVNVAYDAERTPRLLAIAAEHATEATVREAAQRYAEARYGNVATVHIVAPTEPMPTFETSEALVKAAVPIPVTLYTVDCPLCGTDAVQEQSEWGACDDPMEYLHYHVDEHHHDLPSEDDLAEDDDA